MAGHLFKSGKKRGKDLARKLRSIWEDGGGIEMYAAGLLRDIAREHPLNDPYRTLRLAGEIGYEGWREVAAHPRVEHAVENGSEFGMVMVS